MTVTVPLTQPMNPECTLGLFGQCLAKGEVCAGARVDPDACCSGVCGDDYRCS
jgi:hypothetical protein